MFLIEPSDLLEFVVAIAYCKTVSKVPVSSRFLLFIVPALIELAANPSFSLNFFNSLISHFLFSLAFVNVDSLKGI
jgi:hypothetical protein